MNGMENIELFESLFVSVCTTRNPEEHNARTYHVHLFAFLQHVSVVPFHLNQVEITSTYIYRNFFYLQLQHIFGF
jgi:hypothetical protein